MITIEVAKYQTRAVNNGYAALAEQGRALLVGPTGCGKSLMSSLIALKVFQANPAARVLVLQHRAELVAQNAKAILGVCHGRSFATFGSNIRRTGIPAQASIVLGLIQSASRSMVDHLGEFDLIWIDEAHHGASAQYRHVVKELFDRNHESMILGTTATPEGADGGDLSWLFGTTPADIITFEEAIEAGRVMKPDVRGLDVQLTAEMPAVAEAIANLHAEVGDDGTLPSMRLLNAGIVAKWKHEAGGRRTVMFCASIAAAKALAAEFTSHGIDAITVDKDTPTRERNRITSDIVAGRGARIVCNAFLLSEGFDAPKLGCVGLVRSFASRSLMIQCVGRACRFDDDKPTPLVLDFVGAVKRHGGINPVVKLDGRRAGVAAAAADENEAGREQGAPLDRIEIDDCVLTDVDALGGTTTAAGGRTSGGGGSVEVRPIVSRSEAIARGLKVYFTGRPCVRGHYAERRLRGICMECELECGRQRRQDPEFKARQRERRQDPEFKAQERQRRQDPEFKARQRERRQDPEFKARQRERVRQWRQNPDIKARQREDDRQRYQNPEVKARQRERRQDPEFKTRDRQRRQDPEFKARKREYERQRKQDPEVKARQLEYQRRWRQDPEVKARERERYRQRRLVKASERQSQQAIGI